jgi:hypothetical protein
MVLSGRMYIRYTVFRRLLFEDYLMIFAWAIMCASATMCELYVGKVYLIEAVGDGMTAPPINFLDEFEHTLRAVLINNVLSLVGIWVVKFNFLCFFRRIGNQVNAYRISWWTIARLPLRAVRSSLMGQTYPSISSPAFSTHRVCLRYKLGSCSLSEYGLDNTGCQNW